MDERIVNRYLDAIESASGSGDTEVAAELTRQMSDYIEAAGVSTAEGLMGSAAQGLTFGLSDELIGLAAGEPAMQSAREQLAQFRETSPGLSIGAELLGALPTGYGIGRGLLGMATRPGTTGAAGRFLSSPTVGGQAALGGLQGAAYGAGIGETPEERVTGAMVGGGLGALGGGISAPVSNWVTQRLAPGMQAERIITENMARDLGGPPTAADYARMGAQAMAMPELTLAEIPGATTQGLARTLSSVPAGGGMQQARAVLEPRARGTTGRLIGRLRDLTGATGEYSENLAALGQQRQAEAAPLYRAAYNAPFAPDASEELVEVTRRGFRTGDLRRAYTKARQEAMREGQVDVPTWRELTSDPDAIANLDLRTYDLFKRGLDGQYRRLVRTDPSEAASVWRYRQELVEALDEAAPREYRQARAAYADPSRQMEAQELGQDIMRERAEVTRELVESMSEAEREAFTLGAVDAISQRLRSRPRRQGGVTGIPEYVEERLRWAFPSEDAFNDFIAAVDLEQDMQGFKNLIMTRSPTADILRGQEDVARAGGLAAAGSELLRGDLGQAAARLWQGIRPPTTGDIAESIARPTMEMLMSQGPGAVQSLQRLQQPAVMPRLLPPMLTTETQLLLNQLQR